MNSSRKEASELWSRVKQCAQAVMENAPAGRLEIIDAFCRRLDKEELHYRRLAWFPDRCASFFLNCGHLADVVVEDRLALLIDTDDKSLRKLQDNLPGLLASSDCHGAGVLIFDQGMRTYYEEVSVAPAGAPMKLAANQA